MYTVKQAAEIMNISVHTLRFYANNDLFPFIKRDYNNIRQFSDKDLEWVKLVKCLRDTGMPLEEVKKYIDLCKEGERTIQKRFDMLVAQKEKALAQLEDFQKGIDLLTYKVNYYKGCLQDQSKDQCNPATGSLPITRQKKIPAKKRIIRSKSA